MAAGRGYRPVRVRLISVPQGPCHECRRRYFLDNVKTGNPPAVAIPLLRAVWHGLRGEWEAAHHIAQEDTS